VPTRRVLYSIAVPVLPIRLSSLADLHRLMLGPAFLVLVLVLGTSAVQAQQMLQQQPADGTTAPSGPIRLRQPGTVPQDPSRFNEFERPRTEPRPRVYRPGEFERFVQRLANAGRPSEPDLERQQQAAPPRRDFDREEDDRIELQETSQVQIRRFGAELMVPRTEDDAVDFSALVPPDYLIGAGDELVVTMWGSVDADVRVTVDRSGRISLPRVGPVMVAGVRYADLSEVIRRRAAQVFRNFDLSVSLGRLRGVRVYVTGFVERPGAYSVNSLSTVANALLRAGGPTAAGSFRQIQLRRGAQAPAAFDLYDFLLNGDRAGDRLLQAGDVVHVGPVGPQIGVIGSVNKPAVFELKANETVADAVRMAGGFSAVADRSRVAVERLDDRSSIRVSQLALPESSGAVLNSGDVLRVFSVIDVAQPVLRQNKRVRIEGEVLRPGEYIMPAESSISDALAAAGGLTTSAFLFGTEFTRESVRGTQQENYERALRDLETEFTRATSTQRTITADEAAAQNARAAATSRLVERLRAIKPTGRIVLQMEPDTSQLPDLALEDGDRLYVPPRPTTVGVFGSVFNGGSYLYGGRRTIDDYLRLAGGPTKGADAASSFVIRANGTVVSGRQRNGGWLSEGSLRDVAAEPGDTIFVPEEVNKVTFVQNAKDWTQILYQFGVGIAAIATLRN
jgi:protein involved in polysaccharide export with SLBB domain